MATKIYGTIGPACCKRAVLERLFEQGMTGVRINLSHGSLKHAADWIANIHEAYRQVLPRISGEKTAVEILMDLRGPELRIGAMRMPRELCEGDVVSLVADGCNNLFDPTEIPVPEIIVPYLEKGQEILLDDGTILLNIEEIFHGGNGRAAECTVVRGGLLKAGKSIALPGAGINPPTLTDSDTENIQAAKEYGVTGVMLPFVRGSEDLRVLKTALAAADGSDIRVFAKIENMDGVDKLPEIMAGCDEIVIARGDLGNAMPLWKLPVVQEQIAGSCRKAGKPFMVVTQMLASMEHAAVPTRAEVSDIFRAVREGAASVMLTGETAVGDYPVEAMRYLVNTVREAERR